MAVDAFITNFSGMTERVAAKPAKVEPMIQTAELDFKNGWASDLATRQLFNVNGYATLGGKTVTHGAAGFDTRTGAYGIRPIYMPGTR
ncbi:MAG: hypothetical protein SFW65_00290 [Alphaproteobacteria bacterium]|nr:hypothetical protein [Alphaproteobacteria bacterium]